MARAYGFVDYGGPETQQLLDTAVPTPGPGQLLVAVRAAGVNPADWKVRSGQRRNSVTVHFPAVLGREVAGVVEAVGPNTDFAAGGTDADFAVGDAVFGATAEGHGGYAEYTLVDARAAAHKPGSVSFEVAATLPVAAGTAFDIVEHLDIVDADTVLVLGAGGGVGSVTTQLAHAAGAAVLGVASAGKRDLVESCGGLWVESGTGFDERVAAVAERCGAVTAVVDLVGGDVLERAVALTRTPERVVSVADPSRAQALGGSGITRRRTRAVFEQIAKLVERGVLTPHIERAFPLAEAGRALELVESGHTGGKVVVTVP
ncbi:NADP-dependent oxidoreductase [Rhodococcus sp. B50]|uniref:NADP-dependent oxidoreductase n=1 Tax=Rhodococcus sp. B50 TaxID=2682847 RepID=UPI001BD2197A|nr:NADP-dependent oxidoreductase [Rhodococcus sp. B50]MBS9372981.1 Quinone oxidoreductase 1 [Rhodococcus sp. B50]